RLDGRALARQHEQAVAGVIALDLHLDLGARRRRPLRELQQRQETLTSAARNVDKNVGPVDRMDLADLPLPSGGRRRRAARAGRLAGHLLAGEAAEGLLQLALDLGVKVLQARPAAVFLLRAELRRSPRLGLGLGRLALGRRDGRLVRVTHDRTLFIAGRFPRGLEVAEAEVTELDFAPVVLQADVTLERLVLDLRNRGLGDVDDLERVEPDAGTRPRALHPEGVPLQGRLDGVGLRGHVAVQRTRTVLVRLLAGVVEKLNLIRVIRRPRRRGLLGVEGRRADADAAVALGGHAVLDVE